MFRNKLKKKWMEPILRELHEFPKTHISKSDIHCNYFLGLRSLQKN